MIDSDDDCMRGFGKIYSLDKPEAFEIFDHYVEITEKIDGSQFAFGWDLGGKFYARMKKSKDNLTLDTCDKVFRPVLEWALNIKPIPGTYCYGETLCKPRHNRMKYDRVPKNHFALFGARDCISDNSLTCIINKVSDDKTYHLKRNRLSVLAETLDCDLVPIYFSGTLDDEEKLKEFMSNESFLGSNHIEGIVIKSFISSFNTVCAKVVSEEYKEVRKTKIPTANHDNLDLIFEQYKTEARWFKARQALIENGEFTGTMKDIGKLFKGIRIDIEDECKDEIKELLWTACRKQLFKVCLNGVPAWHESLISEEKA